MKKSFMTRALATGLSLAMAFSLSAATNVTTAEAATSKMKVTSKTVTEGKTVKAYMTSSAAKKYRIKSHKESTVAKKYISVAMMSSRKGLKITAKEGALAAANLEKKGVNVKINFVKASSAKAAKKATKVVDKVNLKVVVKAKAKPEEKPVDTLTMTALTATSANELTATFANAVASAEAVSIKVNKAGSTTAVTGTTKWSDDLKSVVFTATAKLTAGTYEMTATDAADSTKTTSQTVVVENEKVASIVIDHEIALTSANKKVAYAYYDVFNQYNESIRTSTTINWTASCDNAVNVNKTTGRIAMDKADGTDHVYGSSIYLTGVYTKTGVNIQKELKVGMEQNLDTIKTFGFVKETDKATILEKLPVNFQANQYVMIFKAFDQNGNEYDANGINFATDVTFISDAPLLVTSDFKDGGVMTIKGEEYYAVKVQPGQYVDKGGEVNITAISNKTGNKTVQNYVIGADAMIASLSLSQPTDVVADGEQNVKIPYTAKDVDGNAITNYETIARATNEISLTASEGTLVVKEENDGTAGVYWSDENVASKAYDYANSSASNEVDRTIALTTVVIGGESNNLLLQVSDMARPVAVKSVELGSDIKTAVVELNADTLTIADFTFVDQYGRTMDDKIKVAYNGDATVKHLGDLAKKFFTLSSFGTGSNVSNYAVKVDKNSNTTTNFTMAGTTAEGAILIGDSGVANVNSTVNWNVPEDGTGKARVETFKYTVAAIKVSDRTNATTADDWDDCDKKYSVNYDVVPVTLVTNMSIKDLKKQYISLGLENSETGAIVGFNDAMMTDTIDNNTKITAVTVPTASTISGNDYEQEVKLAGSYKGVSVVVPRQYATFESDKFDMTSNKINTANVNNNCTLKVGDFYNAKDAKFNRKDASFKVTAHVYSTSDSAIHANTTSAAAVQLAAPAKTVVASDAAPAPAEIKVADFTFNPTNVAYTLDMNALYNNAADDKVTDKWFALDQYGKAFAYGYLTAATGTVNNVVENKNEFAHLDNSFAVSGNATDKVVLSEVEIMDAFDFVIYAANAYGSTTKTIKLTAGADTNACVSNFANNDKIFRQGYLHYAY